MLKGPSIPHALISVIEANDYARVSTMLLSDLQPHKHPDEGEITVAQLLRLAGVKKSLEVRDPGEVKLESARAIIHSAMFEKWVRDADTDFPDQIGVIAGSASDNSAPLKLMLERVARMDGGLENVWKFVSGPYGGLPHLNPILGSALDDDMKDQQNHDANLEVLLPYASDQVLVDTVQQKDQPLQASKKRLIEEELKTRAIDIGEEKSPKRKTLEYIDPPIRIKGHRRVPKKTDRGGGAQGM